MAAHTFEDLARHAGHEIECVTYADENAALECIDCGEVLYDLTKEEPEAARG